ncbi:MAG TPA: hypothetical protein VNZ45_11905 [Bacteroidia bacterium]|nr:hypothetical protein [Bacteroidia bacterium]
MAIIGMLIFGSIALAGLRRIIIDAFTESNGFNHYDSRDLIKSAVALLVVIYAFVFSLVVYIKCRKK